MLSFQTLHPTQRSSYSVCGAETGDLACCGAWRSQCLKNRPPGLLSYWAYGQALLTDLAAVFHKIGCQAQQSKLGPTHRDVLSPVVLSASTNCKHFHKQLHLEDATLVFPGFDSIWTLVCAGNQRCLTCLHNIYLIRPHIHSV